MKTFLKKRKKWQEIKADTKGNYVTFKGRKHYLYEFMKSNYPYNQPFYNQGMRVHGIKIINMQDSLCIHINSIGDAAKVFWYEEPA